MANGDIAVANGMDKVLSTADRRLGYDEINKTRDSIVSFVKPVASGGTGATTAAQARVNLGLANADTGIVGDTLAKRYSDGALDAYQFATPNDPTAANHTTRKAWVQQYVTDMLGTVDLSSRVAKSGDTMTGDLYLPNSTAANSGYTVAYIDGSGRVSRGASSRRFKKFISTVIPASLGNLFPSLQRWQMREGDGAWRWGYIAEDLAANPDTEPFVIYETEADGRTPLLDSEGKKIPLSVEFFGLLMAQNAQLNERVAALEAPVAGSD